MQNQGDLLPCPSRFPGSTRTLSPPMETKPSPRASDRWLHFSNVLDTRQPPNSGFYHGTPRWARWPCPLGPRLTRAPHALPSEEAESLGEPLTRNCSFSFCPDGQSCAIKCFSRTGRSINQDCPSPGGRDKALGAQRGSLVLASGQ